MTDRSIVEAAVRLRREHEPHIVATVVATEGPAYRRPGARMLLTRFRWLAGKISGGVLGGDVATDAWSDTQGGIPKVIKYDASTVVEDDDLRSAFGLGYEGSVQVLLERGDITGRIDALEVAARCFQRQLRGAVATLFETDGDPRVGARIALVGGALEEEGDAFSGALRERLITELEATAATGVSATRTIDTARGTVRVLVEAVIPAPRLFLFGTGHDAVPIATLAHDVGWEVIVCAREERHARRERFSMADEMVSCDLDAMQRKVAESARAIGVVIGHDHDRDREVLGMLLQSDALFIGVLGPVCRTTRMLAELGHGDDPRLRAAADVGIESPQESALALVAEIHDALKVSVELPRSASVPQFAAAS